MRTFLWLLTCKPLKQSKEQEASDYRQLSKYPEEIRHLPKSIPQLVWQTSVEAAKTDATVKARVKRIFLINNYYSNLNRFTLYLLYFNDLFQI